MDSLIIFIHLRYDIVNLGVKSFPIHDDPEYELLESHHEGEGKDFIQSRIYSRRERKTEGF